MEKEPKLIHIIVFLVLICWIGNVFILLLNELQFSISILGPILFVAYVYYGEQASKTREFGYLYGWDKQPPKIKGLVSSNVTYDHTRRESSLLRCAFASLFFLQPLINNAINRYIDKNNIQYAILTILFVTSTLVAHHLIFKRITESENKAYDDYEKKVYEKV